MGSNRKRGAQAAARVQVLRLAIVQSDKELEMKRGSSGKTAGKTAPDKKNPGARMDRDAGEIKSRSADPGQSSYGGFKNEDPRRQHQAQSKKPNKTSR